MRPCFKAIALVLSTVIALAALTHPARARSAGAPGTDGLSPYWPPAVTRWEHVIAQYAQQRHLDPDLVASVIWKESFGRAAARGPTGAVGLMGLKPFEWRPSAEELENPWTNLAWGARALAQIIRDGNGDLYYSLAAYNGGWDQIHLPITRQYATEVLEDYTRAVAVRNGLPADGDWIAIVAVDGVSSSHTVIVLGPQRPLARYTERPWLRADVPSLPSGISPHATVFSFVDERGVDRSVNLWLATKDGFILGSSATRAASSAISPPVQVSNDNAVGRSPDDRLLD